MSLFAQHATLVMHKQSIKSALHNAATSLEYDPHDEHETDYEYTMMFTSKRQAEEVANFAMCDLKEAKRSLVSKKGNLYNVELFFE